MRKPKHLLFTTKSEGEWVYCKHACKVDCDVKSGIDPLPFWLGREQKMLGFLQLLKPIKWQDLLEKGKNVRNEFWTGAKIHFSEKNVLRLGAL